MTRTTVLVRLDQFLTLVLTQDSKHSDPLVSVQRAVQYSKQKALSEIGSVRASDHSKAKL